MSDVEFTPGMLCIVQGGALIRLFKSESTEWVERPTLGLVVGESHQWRIPDTDDESDARPDILVMLNDCRIYHVSSDKVMDPSRYADPSRLFGRLSG